jgi:hypothetical protein
MARVMFEVVCPRWLQDRNLAGSDRTDETELVAIHDQSLAALLLMELREAAHGALLWQNCRPATSRGSSPQFCNFLRFPVSHAQAHLGVGALLGAGNAQQCDLPRQNC